MTAYEKMKAMVKTANDQTLLTAYKLLIEDFDENSDFSKTLTHSVLTNELESRNLIKFNEDTFEYEIVA
jgi:hypothetical protein